MDQRNVVSTQAGESILATNKVLRNTYLLLSLNLIFSACVALFAMHTNAQPVNFILFIAGMFGLSFLTQALSTSFWGIGACFLFTGFLGYVLGPILNLYLHQYVNGSQLVFTSLGATGIIFAVLSGYALTTRKDFSYMGGFLMAGITVAFLAGIASMVFNMPMLNLLVSAAFAILASGMVLFKTSEIINGGETNYILATISLFVALFNLFLSLLRILSFLAGRRS